MFGKQPIAFAATGTRTQESDIAGPLELIESEGWQLDHAGYVFQPTGTESRDKFLASGQIETVVGQIIGIYLFRPAEER